MSEAVLARGGPRLILLGPGGKLRSAFPLDRDIEAAAAAVPALEAGLPPEALRWIRSNPEARIACDDPVLVAALALAGIRPRPPTVVEAREVAEAVAAGLSDLRTFTLALAHRRIELALASDDETLIALAREEERVERAVGREESALAQFLVPEEGPLTEHRRGWELHRAAVERHHAELLDRLGAVARRVVPNLSALLGETVAARLVATAGDRATLGRMSASRLQLLGARRRPGGGRGPRFGVIYRAARMSDVPLDRRGRYARSLAALAVIAARADSLTKADLSNVLIPRRDRRVLQLRRSR